MTNPLLHPKCIENLSKIATLWLLIIKATGVHCWPEGTYGLPMTDAGCPISDRFYWEHGSRTQKTGDGSFASEGTHLAGFLTNEPTDHITQNFCMKTSVIKASEYSWDKGVYCILKRGSCPSGLKKGTVYWDDDVSPFDWTLSQNLHYQTTSGELPDGEYDANTRIGFCCSTDGVVTKPIKLPTDYAFYLYRLGTQCQKVEDMDVSEESVQWSGDQALDRNTGSHPVTSNTPSYMRLYYCYYTPREKSNTIKLVIICVGALAIIFICSGVVMFIIQRVVSWRPKRNKRGSTDAEATAAAQQQLVDNRSNVGQSVIYRPANERSPSAPPGEEYMTLPPSYEEVIRQDSESNNL